MTEQPSSAVEGNSKSPPYCPRGGFITHKAIVSPSGDERGAFSSDDRGLAFFVTLSHCHSKPILSGQPAEGRKEYDNSKININIY